ncbi:helix-turn-helix domain-containing protein [Pseudorhodoplanes sp.]|uniref:helix-turn-helix domain-containing protein n=1 Tax=Pseudorhodoplanes sp. TaxID=1934341 RepID=UPI003D0EC6B3
MSSDLFTALEKFQKANGLNQEELARKLRVSQSHLSRVIGGNATAGNKLLFRIRGLLGSQPNPPSSDKWLIEVAEAAKRSRSFRRLVSSAMELLRK